MKIVAQLVYEGMHRAERAPLYHPDRWHIQRKNGPRIAARHRNVRRPVIKSWQRVLAVLAATMAAVLGVQTIANAHIVNVKRGDTFSGLVSTHCGTSNWQSVAFPGRDKNLIYAGETIDLQCATAAQMGASSGAVAAPAPAPVVVDNGWRNPLPGVSGGSCNYWEWRGSYNHKGEDWPASSGTPIHAAAAGTVSVGWQASGAGNYTMINHGGGVWTVYMHLSSFAVRSGWVNAGDVIGYVGSTGNSTGPHLHFEVHPWGLWNGVTNPVQYLRDRGVSVGC